jgi:hypothetical protein
VDNYEFLSRSLPRGEVKLPSGDVVSLRGLSRAEVVGLKGLSDEEKEVRILALGMDLTDDSAKLVQGICTNAEVDLIIGGIRDLSGLGEGQAKAEYKSV